MTTSGRTARVVRLVVLAALAGFCSLHWANLVTDPPAIRILAVVAVATATAVILAALGFGEPKPWRHLAAIAITLAGLAAGFAAAGLEVRLLAPAHWDELGDGVNGGLVELGEVTYAFDGDGWPRLVLLLGLPALLIPAAALAFWPTQRGEARRGLLALALLLATYGIAVVLYAPGLALMHGFVLLALVAAWLWAPSTSGPRVAVAALVVAGAGAIAVPAAAALDRSSPILDYRSWSWAGGTPSVGFAWDHTYDELDWPRDGTPMLEVRSDSPHYWRAVVLERFDGFGWVRWAPTGASALELPSKVEIGIGGHDEWFETTEVTVRDLRSELAVGPGSVQTIAGLDGSIASDGTALAGEVPTSGQAYRVTSYAPDPSAAQMRAAPAEYADTLSRFTRLDLPTELVPETGSSDQDSETPAEGRVLIQTAEIPFRGEPRRRAAGLIRASGYGGVLALARRLTRGTDTAYGAVTAIERHLQSGYEYTESPPQSDRPLRSFLLHDRAGYCQQFSGAMALMLRMNGIPARVVSGFSPGTAETDPDRGSLFTVRDTDAHSWTEVYFMGLGWVPFDPTPSASPARSQTSLNAIAATPGDLPGRPNLRPREARVGRGGTGGAGTGGEGVPWQVLAVVPALGALTCIALLAALARRRVRFGSLGRSARAEAQVRELASAFAGTRYRSRGGATLAALERQLRGARRPAAAAYVARLRAVRYSPHAGSAPSLRQRRAARRELGASRGLGARLRLLVAMPPGGPASPPGT